MNLYNAIRNGIWKREGENIVVYRCNILAILRGYWIPLFEKKVFKPSKFSYKYKITAYNDKGEVISSPTKEGESHG